MTRKNNEYNPRYLNYAKYHGNTPTQQLRDDEERWRGGPMTGYILWVNTMWREWRGLKGYTFDRILSDKDYAEYDSWLSEKCKSRS